MYVRLPGFGALLFTYPVGRNKSPHRLQNRLKLYGFLPPILSSRTVPLKLNTPHLWRFKAGARAQLGLTDAAAFVACGFVLTEAPSHQP